MKNRNSQLTAVLFVMALAFAPIAQAAPHLEGGPVYLTANEGMSPDKEQGPVVTIHSTADVSRGNTGSFVLDMKSVIGFGAAAMYVNFTLSGTAVPGVDYVMPFPPAYIGPSGYGTILIKTLPDPRGSSNVQAYSVVVTLDPGAGYSVGQPSSAVMWISPSSVLTSQATTKISRN